MDKDPWLPIGFELKRGKTFSQVLFDGLDWQIVQLRDGCRALLARDSILQKWHINKLIDEQDFDKVIFGNEIIKYFIGKKNHLISPVNQADGPKTKTDALAFAIALKSSREIDPYTSLQDSIYIESLSRLLPTYSISDKMDDAVLLGFWLTRGANVSAKNFRRLKQTVSWLSTDNLKNVVESAGLITSELSTQFRDKSDPANDEICNNRIKSGSQGNEIQADGEFYLAGRPELTSFFNEHVIDIIRNRKRYESLGISHPPSIILHGPPGCGKTFAVEKLVEYLDWPSFQIDASSIGSPYIHETSKKVAKIFDDAMMNAPSVVVIDEMEAFLADRDMASGHHRIEEVAEFLRRIPEAVEKGVLIIGMTNRIEFIDAAIQRRGRFDHVIKVDLANEQEISQLLADLLSKIPSEKEIDLNLLARKLSGRPLSDVSFVVREGARIAAKSGRHTINNESIQEAMRIIVQKSNKISTNKIGFI